MRPVSRALPMRRPPPCRRWVAVAPLDERCSPVDRDDGEIELGVDLIKRGESRAQHELLVPGKLARIEGTV